MRGPERRRVRNRRTTVVWPGPEEGPGALCVPTKGQRAGRKVGRKEKQKGAQQKQQTQKKQATRAKHEHRHQASWR